jgi:hypothetical protein
MPGRAACKRRHLKTNGSTKPMSIISIAISFPKFFHKLPMNLFGQVWPSPLPEENEALKS